MSIKHWKNYKNECKALKVLQSDASIVILTVDKCRATELPYVWGLLKKCIYHINYGTYQLPKKDPTIKINAKKAI